MLFFLSIGNLYSNPIEDAIVKIFVTGQSVDYNQPWQKEKLRSSSGSGFIIENNKILTCAHVVEFGEYFEVRKSKDPKRYSARVLFVAPDCDLAILEVNDLSFFKDIKGLTIGDFPEIGDNVSAFGFPVGGDKISITKGIVSRIEQIPYSYSCKMNLGIQIDAAINPGNSGGPIIKEETVVGIAFQGSQRSENIGYIIPSSIIKHFLIDIKDGEYNGVPPINFSYQNLENQNLREMLGLNDNYGVLVKSIHESSFLYPYLRKGDVLISINDKKIENDGSIYFEENFTTSFECFFRTKNKFDTIEFVVYRDKQYLSQSLILDYKNENCKLIPKIDLNPKYYINSGYVFVVCSYYYMESSDRLWERNQPFLNQLYLGGACKTDSLQEIVMLSSVLPDASNYGNHMLKNLIVESVDGKRIGNMEELRTLLEDKSVKYHQIRDRNNTLIVIDTELMDAVNTQMHTKYGIEKRFNY